MEYVSKGQMRPHAPHGIQADRLNAVSEGQIRPLAPRSRGMARAECAVLTATGTLFPLFSLGQNQAQQIQTQAHGPRGLHKVMIEGHRSQ